MSERHIDLRLVAAPVLFAVLLFVTAAASRDDGTPRKRELISPKGGGVLTSRKVDIIYRGERGTLLVNGEARVWETFAEPLAVASLELEPGEHEIRVDNETLRIRIDPGAEPADPKSELRELRELSELGESCTSVASIAQSGSTGVFTAVACHAMQGSGPKRCGVCHEIAEKDGLTAVGKPKSYEACFECHPAKKFEMDHAHILEPLQACGMCHAMHGAKYRSLLKAPMRRLCGECHDPDH